MEKEKTEKKFPNVFMDITGDGRRLGRIVFELFEDCPKTSENFRCLCTGEKGLGKSGKRLHYKGNIIHRVIPGFLMQGGDLTNGDGTGGDSIYGRVFDDENFIHKHDDAFQLCMANYGNPNTNSSQFYITYHPCPWLDGSDVVFGRVIQGDHIIITCL